MPGQRPVRIGIIGCGWAAEQGHLPALARMPGVEVVAVADHRRERVDLIGDAFDVARRYSEHLELVEDPAVDAVGICVPAHSHVEVAGAIASVDARKPVLLEEAARAEPG